jgi:hypothetical protein
MGKALWTIFFLLFSTEFSFSQIVPASKLKGNFKTPPYEYRPFFPYQGAGGSKYQGNGNVKEEIENIFINYGYGGVMVSPNDDKPFISKHNFEPSYKQHIGSGLQSTLPTGASPWLMTLPPDATPYKYKSPDKNNQANKPFIPPAYLSTAYFNQLKEILALSKKYGRRVIFYDEVGYPSGIANHASPEKYYRKLLNRDVENFVGPGEFKKSLPLTGTLMAVVAMNTSTLERIDLSRFIKESSLVWNAPTGNWKVTVFNCVTATAGGGELDYRSAIDYMDPEAINWFVDKVYEPHAKEVGEYFGNVLFQTFFDDVGIFDEERTWTTKFNEKFKSRTGLNPAIYYPALWENIGEETDAARVAFFDTRAELLAEGFPKIVTDWGNKNNIEVSGHCPGNYDPQPVDMNGDPFKFYRAQPIPMVDVIFAYPTGRDGFKLISDGADYYDKPIVAAETFSSFSPPGQTAGYRRLMELYVRGINRLMGSGEPSADSTGSLTAFAEWVGRSSMMLQGGKRISDIAIFYPIADLEAYYHFDAAAYTKEMRWGTFVPYDNDFLAIGEMLLGNVHRDFTFIHPDFLLSEKIKLNGGNLELTNKVNNQSYKALIIPGQRVISLKALEKIKAYYDQGGIVIGTSLLPSKAAELESNSNKMKENDKKVQAIIKEIFSIDATLPMPKGISPIKNNKKNGKAVFLSKPDEKSLENVLHMLNIDADIYFSGNPAPTSGGGMFSYIHKEKEKKDIYFFANSSNDVIETFAEVRGKINPEVWDPATGKITTIAQKEYINKNGKVYTRFPLRLEAITSTFVVSEKREL